MKPRSFMVIAGEASGDLLAAELVQALREEINSAENEAALTPDAQPLFASLEPQFFGAGGPRMAAAGVELAFDLTAHSVVGLSDVVRNYAKLRRFFQELYRLALEREPDAIICVDFSEFNLRFAQAIKRYVRARLDWFHDWNPKLIRYVSPQVWASREGRARQIARDYDLLLSIIPFEKDWYARRVPQLPVEFIGHPLVDRHSSAVCGVRSAKWAAESPRAETPLVLLLPGSRVSELARHLPVMLEALKRMGEAMPKLHAQMVLPNQSLVEQARRRPLPANLELRQGGLPESLREADVAIASTGTVTLECAYFGVPTVALYKTSWTNYVIGKRVVRVKHLAMPNLLAGQEIFPEFIQGAATGANLARAALALLRDEARRQEVKAALAKIAASLGQPGASHRAARAVIQLLRPPQPLTHQSSTRAVG